MSYFTYIHIIDMRVKQFTYSTYLYFELIFAFQNTQAIKVGLTSFFTRCTTNPPRWIEKAARSDLHRNILSKSLNIFPRKFFLNPAQLKKDDFDVSKKAVID